MSKTLSQILDGAETYAENEGQWQDFSRLYQSHRAKLGVKASILAALTSLYGEAVARKVVSGS